MTGWRLAVSLLAAAGEIDLIEASIAGLIEFAHGLPEDEQLAGLGKATGAALGAMSVFTGAMNEVVNGLAGEGKAEGLLRAWVEKSREQGFV
jgi:acyl transferase domain-containing protein